MKQQRIYLDTSVIGGCLDKEFAPWSNGLFRDFREGYFVPVVSHLVAAEVLPAPGAVREKYRELIDLDAEMLEESLAAAQLAARYQEHRILPETYTAAACTSRWQRLGRSTSLSAGTSGTSCGSIGFDSSTRKSRGGLQGDRDLLPAGGHPV